MVVVRDPLKVRDPVETQSGVYLQVSGVTITAVLPFHLCCSQIIFMHPRKGVGLVPVRDEPQSRSTCYGAEVVQDSDRVGYLSLNRSGSSRESVGIVAYDARYANYEIVVVADDKGTNGIMPDSP